MEWKKKDGVSGVRSNEAPPHHHHHHQSHQHHHQQTHHHHHHHQPQQPSTYAARQETSRQWLRCLQLGCLLRSSPEQRCEIHPTNRIHVQFGTGEKNNLRNHCHSSRLPGSVNQKIGFKNRETPGRGKAYAPPNGWKFHPDTHIFSVCCRPVSVHTWVTPLAPARRLPLAMVGWSIGNQIYLFPIWGFASEIGDPLIYHPKMLSGRQTKFLCPHTLIWDLNGDEMMNPVVEKKSNMSWTT